MAAAKSSDLDYGLHHVAQHNAGLSLYPINDDFDIVNNSIVSGNTLHDFETEHEVALYTTEQAYGYQNPENLTPRSTPRSNTASEGGRRTRSGLLSQRHDSPLSSVKGSSIRVSKSPRAPKKARANRKPAGPSRIPGPLSELTAGSTVAVKDIDGWVNRSSEARIEESIKRKGHIARPMNSFMLYRSAYAERTKEWCKQNNHQVVSSVAGESWPMESDELREQFNEWSRIERDNHALAFPNYKFSPSKSNHRKHRDDEEEDEGISFKDPDGEYMPSRRAARPHRPETQEALYHKASPYTMEPYGYTTSSDPYAQAWTASQQPRPLPSPHGMAEQYGVPYYQPPPTPEQYYHQMEDVRLRAVVSPASFYAEPPPVGLPSDQHDEYQQTWHHQTAAPYQYHPVQQAVGHRQAAGQYQYSLPSNELQYAEGYGGYASNGLGVTETGWELAVDPSLNETGSMYGSGLHHMDQFGYST